MAPLNCHNDAYAAERAARAAAAAERNFVLENRVSKSIAVRTDGRRHLLQGRTCAVPRPQVALAASNKGRVEARHAERAALMAAVDTNVPMFM